MLSRSELLVRRADAPADAPTPSLPAAGVAVAPHRLAVAVVAAAAPPVRKEVGDGVLHASVVPQRQFAPSQKVKGKVHFHRWHCCFLEGVEGGKELGRVARAPFLGCQHCCCDCCWCWC